MAMERRDLLKLTGLALMGLGGLDAALAEDRPDDDLTTFLHVWADEGGVTHAKIRPISKTAKPLPFSSEMNLHFDSRPVVAQHQSPQRQFVITLQGEFELEGSDGTRLKAPQSGLSYLEDTAGQGHIAHLKDAVNINLAAPAGFDVLRWARGEG
jgi:hypothetical protein